MRDREYTIDKPDGVYRIAVLGDSIVFGHGIKLEKTYTKRLEDALNKRGGVRYEVMNFGVPGYATKEEAEVLATKAERFDPDLVILGYCLNDETPKPGNLRPLHSAYYPAWEKFYVLDFFRDHIDNALEQGLGVTKLRFHVRSNVSEDFKYLEERRDKSIPLLVVVFPNIWEWNKYATGWKKYHGRIAEASDENGFLHMDLLEEYKKYPPEKLYLHESDLRHPNEFGHKLCALATAEHLGGLGLLPPGGDPVK